LKLTLASGSKHAQNQRQKETYYSFKRDLLSVKRDLASGSKHAQSQCQKRPRIEAKETWRVVVSMLKPRQLRANRGMLTAQAVQFLVKKQWLKKKCEW
jgi:hypothetical protein